jgi:hypothetical protein
MLHTIYSISGLIVFLGVILLFGCALKFVWSLKMPYYWFKSSVGLFLGGYLLSNILIIIDPTLRVTPALEEAARIKLDILATIYLAIFTTIVLLIIDACHHPERGLGRLWPLAEKAVEGILVYVRKQCCLREQSRWEDIIEIEN